MYNVLHIYSAKYVFIYMFLISDRQPVSEHLPLARTHSTEEEEMRLMTRLEELKTRFFIVITYIVIHSGGVLNLIVTQ